MGADLTKSDYTTVTEISGNNVTPEQIQRMYTRYRFAAQFCDDKDVLEVACGTGQGLGYLARKAKTVVGGDCDENMVKCAEDYYKDRVDIHQIDAHGLPYEDNSYDVVILFEAIYYLGQPEKFIQEARRVLKENGVLLVCTANKDLADFNPSPYSKKYFSANELYGLLKKFKFHVELYGDCPVSSENSKDKIVSFIKKAAVGLHLMPKTMKGKEKLKRLFIGKLQSLPAEVKDGMAEYSFPTPIPHDRPNSEYKVIFAVARI